MNRLVDLYREWNEKINVISRKDIDNLYEHHILHSLSIAEYLRRYYGSDVLNGAKVLDVGTGGGFPGIPLAMEFPLAHFTLCDSIAKKIKVARAVAEAVDLKNVECVNARVETLDSDFDWVVSRAVCTLDKFYPWVKGRFNNSILYLKGGDINTEISDLIKKCGVNPKFIRTWKISEWLNNDYFNEKFVIEISNSYICRPKSE